MSSPLALAATTAVLRNLLDNGMVDAGPAVGAITVTAVAPDLVKVDDPALGPRLNLFLHRVSPNGWLSNAGLPTRSGDGTRVTNPPLALDLHYLLTAYASERLPGRDPARLRDVDPARAPGARPDGDPDRARPRARSGPRSCPRRSRHWRRPTSPTRRRRSR